MANCANCGIVLEREWKFCVMCGTPVKAVAVTPPPVIPVTPPPVIPAVFRHEAELDDIVPQRKKLNIPVLVSVGVGVIGVVLIILVAIIVFMPRG